MNRIHLVIFGTLGFIIVIALGVEYLAYLPEAKQMQIVDLKDGDTYDLTAEVVKKKIGNREIRMLAYNGSIPGPLIRAPKGTEITLRFTNKIDVPTTIHSHGVRLANEFDGVPDVTQKEIKPGDSFTYKIKFPDEGVYWYHPHIREDYTQELGMYGNYVVAPDNPNYYSPVDRAEYLFLDDIYLENGQTPFDKAIATHALMGRFGNVMLVNGEIDYRLQVNKNDVVRLFFTNSANTRVFNIRIPGA
ncbi:MAG: multicopper oxidase domain-containing protein, partial [Patescibacteria group bacterium]